MRVHLALKQTINQSINQSSNQSNNQSVSQSINQSINLYLSRKNESIHAERMNNQFIQKRDKIEEKPCL